MTRSILVLKQDEMLQLMYSLGFNKCVEPKTQVNVTVRCLNKSCYSSMVVRQDNEIESRQSMLFKNEKTKMFAAYCPYCKRVKFTADTVKEREEVDKNKIRVIIHKNRQTKVKHFYIFCEECLNSKNYVEADALNDDLYAILPMINEVKVLVGAQKTYDCEKCGDQFV